ncbi:MAG: GAF domain-containing protein [Spirochaetales bacterium]|nr:GAF domain-containing protein [Spirochaetales bacterium]
MGDANNYKKEKETESLLNAMRSILNLTSFEEIARIIFNETCRITGAKSGYVALLSEDGSENEVLFLESGGLPCSVNPELPMPIRGLREKAYRENKVVYDNNFMKSDWTQFLPAGHVSLENVMFAPLVIQGKTVGIIGLANKDGDFDEYDAHMAGVFGEFAAIALRNCRTMDRLNNTISELNNAMKEIKVLQEIIPICAKCKKIRDDQGYWEQVEIYITKRLDTSFSHGLCPECYAEIIESSHLDDDSIK